MVARQVVWPDPVVRKLTEKFIPAADYCYGLQNGTGPDCEFFRRFCEKGHYGGRTKPSKTRQGTYAVAPSGEFLASINSNDAREIEAMLKKALEAWEQLPRDRRLSAEPPPEDPEGLTYPKRVFPEGGLVLWTTVRDLPRDLSDSTFYGKVWNHDVVWFRKDEAAQFLPGDPRAGMHHEIPPALVNRLARLHFIDNVRGSTDPFKPHHVSKADLRAKVLTVQDGLVTLRLEGETSASEEGKWPVNGFQGRDNLTEQRRGFDARVLGYAAYDLRKESFVAFEMVAIGIRWGGTQWNERANDLDPAPMGVALVLAGDSPVGRAPLKVLTMFGMEGLTEDYGWK
ncbi:MAG: hypothetical protein HYY16_01760 [Planctomycetes bacterium]|nr:hypothetical protein [Planctomycetota bacterium]